ncbi:hypothetical protein [Bacillus cereus]|uniref:hypothetical protein n=1 Tax=Bacillus cereus TaxID=1396 RepID=UPI00397FC48F
MENAYILLREVLTAVDQEMRDIEYLLNNSNLYTVETVQLIQKKLIGVEDNLNSLQANPNLRHVPDDLLNQLRIIRIHMETKCEK